VFFKTMELILMNFRLEGCMKEFKGFYSRCEIILKQDIEANI
jgi:hypothetical protein